MHLAEFFNLVNEIMIGGFKYSWCPSRSTPTDFMHLKQVRVIHPILPTFPTAVFSLNVPGSQLHFCQSIDNTGAKRGTEFPVTLIKGGEPTSLCGSLCGD